MRVLMINSERGWRGGENQVALLVAGLGGGIETLTACQPGGELEQALLKSGAATAPVAMRGPLHLGAVRALRRLIRERGIDLVHAHTSHGHSLGLFACWGLQAPLVVTRRVDFAVGRSLLGRWKYGPRVARFAAISDGVKGVLITGGVPAERIAVIHDGIDFARFADRAPSTLRREFALPDGAIAIGVTAQLTDHKDHHTLLAAFAKVEQTVANAWLFVIGAGDLEAELKGQATALALKRTVFTGFRSDIPNLLRGLDGFVLSSHLEGLGSSIMDAMYCGLPVVATRAGGIPELIHDGDDGLLVPIRDPPALAAALIRVCSDADLRRRLGAAAQHTATARFGAPIMVAGYAALYRSLLDGE